MTRRPHNPRDSRNGFTLIEVMASLLLIALVLPVAMQCITTATKAGSVAKHRTEAAALAQSKLHELVATGDWQGGQLSGNFGDDFPAYQWEARLGQWVPPAGTDSNSTTITTVEQLDVMVSWDRTGQPGVTLSTLVYPNANPNTASTSVGNSANSANSSSTSGTSGTGSGGAK